MLPFHRLKCAVAVPCIVLCAADVQAQPQQQPQGQIEKLLADGGEVAGYISAWENRSLILFKNKNQPYLVQCSVLIDVMRNPRVVTYCYEIR
jgi:hypothetical protein